MIELENWVYLVPVSLTQVLGEALTRLTSE